MAVSDLMDRMSDAALDAYLERIRFRGFAGPTTETLRAIHRAHLNQISYENLDIHFGRPLSLRLEDVYRKIVVQGRGGWCFEMNTLLRWALDEAGFKTTLLRATAAFEGDHMLLMVQVKGERYLADMGWGNGFLEPLPLVPGRHQQGFRQFELTRDSERWRFHNLDFGEDGFDFDLAPRESSDFSERSDWLQRDPESSFVRVVKGFRFGPDGELHALRGAVLTTLGATGKTVREIRSASEYADVWRDVFHSPLTNVTDLWPKVHEDHVAWTRTKANA